MPPEQKPEQPIDMSFVNLAEGTLGKEPEVSIEEKPALTPEALDEKFAITPISVEPKPEDVARTQEILQNIAPTIEQASIEPVKLPEQIESEKIVSEYIGEPLEGKSKAEIREDILLKEEEKSREANKNFWKVGGSSLAVGTITSLGAWVAAGSGVGVATSLAGMPLMTAVALGAAPVGLSIAIIAGAVWTVRRYLNHRKANKAYNSF